MLGVLAGRVTPEQAVSLPRSGAEALFASRLAAQSFTAGDVGQYEGFVRSRIEDLADIGQH